MCCGLSLHRADGLCTGHGADFRRFLTGSMEQDVVLAKASVFNSVFSAIPDLKTVSVTGTADAELFAQLPSLAPKSSLLELFTKFSLLVVTPL